MAEQPKHGGFWASYTPPWRHRTALLVLFLVIFVTYRPALGHPPRQDQWAFLLDTVNEDHFWPMVLQTYSYNRTRLVGWGDYLLFRPVLFALLSAEKALFGTHYTYWQTVGIVLHCAIVWVFLSILLRLHHTCPPAFPEGSRLRLLLAYLLALFFAVNVAGTEMVSWCHIHGYLLFTLLVLASLRLVLEDLLGSSMPSSGSSWRVVGACFLTLVAAFTYELGCLYAVCLGSVLGLTSVKRGQVRRGVILFALFASILPLSRVVDGLDRRSHPEARPDVTEAAILERATLMRTSNNALRYVLFTLCQPFFPSSLEWSFDERLRVSEPRENPQLYWRLEPILIVSYVVVLTGVGLGAWQLIRGLGNQRVRSGFLFLLLPASLIAFQMAIIVLGRMNMRPESVVLARNAYYAYLPLLLLLLGTYYLCLRMPFVRRWESAALVVILTGLAILSWCSATKVHQMLAEIRLIERPLRGQINGLQKLIASHRYDARFALSFDPELFMHGLGMDHSVTRMEILFGRYFDHENPTHVVCADRADWFVLTEEEYCRRYGGPRYRQLPKFIQPGTMGFLVSRYQQRYYALHYLEGPYRATRHDCYYLIEGDSVAEVLHQVPATVKRAAEDRRSGRYVPPRTPVVCLGQVYRGFALYQAGGHVHAIPEDESPLVPTRLVAREYRAWFRAFSVAAVKRLIDADEAMKRTGNEKSR